MVCISTRKFPGKTVKMAIGSNNNRYNKFYVAKQSNQGKDGENQKH